MINGKFDGKKANVYISFDIDFDKFHRLFKIIVTRYLVRYRC